MKMLGLAPYSGSFRVIIANGVASRRLRTPGLQADSDGNLRPERNAD